MQIARTLAKRRTLPVCSIDDKDKVFELRSEHDGVRHAAVITVSCTNKSCAGRDEIGNVGNETVDRKVTDAGVPR